MNVFIQQSAELDILSQVEWRAQTGVPTPIDGFAKPLSKRLRQCPPCRIYYPKDETRIVIVRILHGKRDIEGIPNAQETEDFG